MGTLNDLMNCANAHDPTAPLVGNVTARDVRMLCIELVMLRNNVEKLEKLIEDLEIDPNPESEEPDAVVKRHHAKAWEWARIAFDACNDVDMLRARLERAEVLLTYPLIHQATPEWSDDVREFLQGASETEGLREEWAKERRAREVAEAECQAWRNAHGTFGPRTPEEVTTFEQEARRVDAEVAEHEKGLRATLELRAQAAEQRLEASRTQIERAVDEIRQAKDDTQDPSFGPNVHLLRALEALRARE